MTREHTIRAVALWVANTREHWEEAIEVYQDSQQPQPNTQGDSLGVWIFGAPPMRRWNSRGDRLVHKAYLEMVKTIDKEDRPLSCPTWRQVVEELPLGDHSTTTARHQS